ncbi:hypothetical protein H4R33_000116 [Dimargaris cristalligena]|uniref:Protein yippee-like n=1 Tax=Dimargaris cristalligena TaxID=215637 RepID=A0A4P9ZPP3_9FUNG|nr:hypothetical protein H4R33_000116 [Dimargaris cristalligena]RKP35404.1 yippee zinc-binding protein [Dimargaris cristalligena]|eukprot:RKP35404.1 yippee zinc-binding protein [Dimargaris cristalligena]
MGMKHKVYMDPKAVYSCSHCETHFTVQSELVSKNFTGRHGAAYLFHTVANVYDGKPCERTMLTGDHIVCDLYCMGCMHIVGWKYIKAFTKTEKYKENKSILEISILNRPRK